LLRTIEGVNELHQYKKELLEKCKNEAWPDMREGHRQITAGEACPVRTCGRAANIS
jgi:hypothetical protein